ncbi:MAG: GPR endopeptidase [Oscillospiraceae bacterium]|nr:GPR endopeptidase [Oscillospiraceae bacterium]
MFEKRTDLALEARELWQESAGKTTRLTGVRAKTSKQEGYAVTRVEILNEKGEAALGKPAGNYLTIDLSPFSQRRDGFFERAVRVVGAQLRSLLPARGSVLVVGLGNRAMTADAVGPLAVESVLVTRHMVSTPPFSDFRPVAALSPGVLAATGVETAEAVGAVAEQVRPAAVIAIDALAARRMSRVCATVQLADTGISPGSGVGNHRSPLNRETLGVPVIAVGVPTVVDAATIAADLLEESGGGRIDPDRLRHDAAPMMVTPRDIDRLVRELAKVVGYGINWALQEMEIEDMTALLT